MIKRCEIFRKRNRSKLYSRSCDVHAFTFRRTNLYILLRPLKLVFLCCAFRSGRISTNTESNISPSNSRHRSIDALSKIECVALAAGGDCFRIIVFVIFMGYPVENTMLPSVNHDGVLDRLE